MINRIKGSWGKEQKLALETVEAPLTGTIIDVKVSVGSNVSERELMFLIESMKMENPVFAPVSGTVKEVRVSPGQRVKNREVLAIIEY